ncbi:hypothetical protein LVJ94_48670 [Pendulispora rubella]|uniref:Uncharacterized protein n=1 Tax=Pendulispora rubella TaxID=2741070 RepID=A0ABZ2L1Y4_9BACT
MHRPRTWPLVLAISALLPGGAAAQALPPAMQTPSGPACSDYLPPPRPHGGHITDADVYQGMGRVADVFKDIYWRGLAAIVPSPALLLRDRARAAILWSVSIGLDGNEDERGCWRTPRHRFAVEGGTVLGEGLSARAGYRYLFQPATSPLGLGFGLGAQLADYDEKARLSVSPEASLRWGPTERPGSLSLLARRDVPLAGPFSEGAWWFLIGVSYF